MYDIIWMHANVLSFCEQKCPEFSEVKDFYEEDLS